MAKKIGDLDKKERDDIASKVNATATILGDDSYEGRIPTKASGYGICSQCKKFQYARTEFEVRVAKCYEYEVNLSDAVPITDCTAFDEKGKLTLFEMQQIAWSIDPSEEQKKIIGFGKADGEDEDE